MDTNLIREDESPKRRAAAYVCCAYILLVSILKLVSPDAGWAAADARDWHLPVINYFLDRGFNFGYPNLLAMFPGMHLFFAGAAKIFGIASLAYNGSPAFLIQSITGLIFLLMLRRLLLSICVNAAQLILGALVILSSSYTLHSWMWPTTELGSSACYVAMLGTLCAPVTGAWSRGAAFSVESVISIFWRQSSATTSAALLLSRLASKGQRLDRAEILASLMPIVSGGVLVLLLVFHWHGLVPPGFERHRAAGLNWTAAIHLIALTGLLGWPFAITTLRSLRVLGRRLPMYALAFAIFASLLSCRLPLNYNMSDGRWGSLIWSVESALGPLGIYFVAVCLVIGFWIWAGVAIIGWFENSLRPEIVLLSCLAASLLVQSLSWQRYIEFPLLASMAVFFVPRITRHRIDANLALAWFGLYACSGVAKAALGLSAG